MRLEKIEENEKVQYFNFYDFINCGECYLLTDWINEERLTVTLNKDTVLEDLHEKHGGSIRYDKFCSKTFRVYMGKDDTLEAIFSKDLDKVINRTETSNNDGYYFTRLLKTLVTGKGLKKLSIAPCVVRWVNEGSSRGKDWYRLLKS